VNTDNNDDAALAGRSPDTPAGPEAGDGAGESEAGHSRRSRGHRGGRRHKGAGAAMPAGQDATAEATAGPDVGGTTSADRESPTAAESRASGERGLSGEGQEEPAAGPRTVGGYSVQRHRTRTQAKKPAQAEAASAPAPATDPADAAPLPVEVAPKPEPAGSIAQQTQAPGPATTESAPAASAAAPAGSGLEAAAEGDTGEAAADEAARPARRRRRGGRRHKTAAQRAAAAAAEATGSTPQIGDTLQAADVTTAPEGANLAAAAPVAAEARARGRRSSPPQTQAQALSAAAAPAQGAPVEQTAPVAVASTEIAGATTEPPRPARRRSGRGRGTATAEAVAETAVPGGEATAADAPVAEAVHPEGAGAAKEQPKPARRRRGRGRGTAATADADMGQQSAAEVPGAAPAEPSVEEAAAAPARKRRSSRRPKAAAGTEAATADAEAPAGESPAPSAETAEEGRRRGRRPSRRPAGPPPIPPTERVILASQEYGELRVVLLEQGRLAEVYFQRPERPSYLGNIYRAKVESVLRGMDAAFVDFGLEKNGFLHVDEVTVENGGSRHGRRITQLLQNGQEILVQVTKDPMGSKGARLTTRMSLPGRYLVYVPGGSGVGVSRRLPQEERERLRDICKALNAKDAGLIVRTVAEGKGIEELRRDLQYLARSWTRIKAKSKTAQVPGLVHEEVDVALSVARDLFNESCSRFIVDGEKLRKEATAYISRVAPELVDRIELHEGPEALFDAWGIEEQLDRTLMRRVMLPSGGNIVIDHAEALTVIDVNSGKYTGGSGLEDTITKTNLEAASECVHQLRLRDIGGIIVIDFIDMERSENRKAVLGKLETELARDRTKTYVVEISPLGLVEMTRQNTTDGARGILTKPCPTCLSTARVPSEDTVARRVERQLRAIAASNRAAALLIEVNGNVAQRLSGNDRIRRLEKDTSKKFVFQGSKTLPVETFELIASGSAKEIETQRIPVLEGVEMDVQMEHSLTYSPRDAVAVVEGYPLVVKNGRQFLGMRRRVRVETAIRSGGTAVIVGSAAT
jgi:ribonuclease G